MIPIARAADMRQIEALIPRVRGRRCVVVGSAPLKTPKAEVDKLECVIAVNGGISSLPGRADVWVLNSKQQDRAGDPRLKPMHKAMLEQGRGRTAGHLILLRGPEVESEIWTLEALADRACRYESWSVLDKKTKRWFEGEHCGRELEKKPCSAGILTVAAALWCGAEHVRMVGFSLKPGYHYMPTARPLSWWRDHIWADHRAVKILSERYGDRLSGSLVDKVAA